MSTRNQTYSTTKRSFWTVTIFYLLIAFEFFYMASPFAIYFYSIYGPGLEFINGNPALAWLSSTFLPHIVAETSSMLVNLHNVIGILLVVIGFFGFCISAIRIYYSKLTRKEAVTSGVYKFIRHPQYLSLIICSFGLLLLWPRYIVLLSILAMLFAYYFLAKAEEAECEEKFGQSYVDYKNKTSMFLPFRLPLDDKLPSLPKSGMKRLLAILALYMFTAAVAVGIANGLRSWALNSLYALYNNDAVYISATKMAKDSLEHITKIALKNPEVQTRLKRSGAAAGSKFINYVLPVELYVSEVPMNPVDGARGNHFLPAKYNENLYKIIFTKAEPRPNREMEGKNILLNTLKRIPVVEVWIDLSKDQVIEIKNPPSIVNYENIPVPIF